MINEVYVKKLSETARLPLYTTSGSAGADLFADCPDGVTLVPGKPTLIGTGLALAIPSSEYVGLVYVRSGLSLKGICLSNAVGVIDSDYRGELKIALTNNGEEPFFVEHAQRIAQLVITPVAVCNFVESEELPETKRGVGGFGSTGTK